MASDKKKVVLLLSLLLLVVTLLVFHQVRGFEFVHYDDDVYVAGNGHVQAGLTPSSIAWAFSTTDAGFWHPLTWLSLMLDHELYGLNAGGYHGTNLIWHLLNTLLIFFVFLRMTGAVWRSAFLAALFALHPLHVESVAWIAERKDVLSTFFWLLTMAAYVVYVRRPGRTRYLLLLLVFSLGLMAKPMLVTLPFCLLLMDFWPLGRTRFMTAAMPAEDRKDGEEGQPMPRGLWSLFAEKAPLFVLAFLAGLLVYYTEERAGVLSSFDAFPLSLRIAHAFVSYFLYLGKAVWPVNLAVFYPHPGAWPSLWVALAAGLLIACTILTVRWHRRFPYALTGWLWYLGTMAPLIGLVQLGTQGMADRYTYVPLTGIFLILAWGLPDILGRWKYRVAALSLGALIVLSLLGGLAWRQAGYWRDAETLFRQAVRVTDNNYLAHNNLGAALAREGKTGAALGQYRAALAIKPHYADAHFNMGQSLAASGRLAEAEQYYRKALKSKPSFAEAHNNLGIVLAEQGKGEEARSHFLAALQIRPDYETAGKNLRLLLQKAVRLPR